MKIEIRCLQSHDEIACGLAKNIDAYGFVSPMNVREAIRTVRPFGVDVCSRLRPAGVLDREILRDFVRSAHVVE